MEFNFNILLAAVTVCVISQQAECLQCYSCNNILEPKCGKTWELSEDEASKYVISCEGENAACRKIDTQDSNKGEMLVTRSCWTTNPDVQVTLDSEFLDCRMIGKQGASCYCKGKTDGKPCNGTPPKLANMSLVMAAVSILFKLIL